MIPKIIHYCWFGRGAKPELAVKCIDSWKKFCPDYKIVEWNEDNFDVNCNSYVKEAYDAKKYAFVSDYVRLYAMYTCGGIYMDTDVEALKPLDEFLWHEALSGFENSSQIQTGLMACREGFPLFGELLEYYDTAKFINSDGALNMKTNVAIITEILLKRGFIPNGEYQVIEGFAIYPKNVFCPEHKRLEDKQYMKDAVTIHYFAGSWRSEAARKRKDSLCWKVIVFFGSRTSKIMSSLLGNKWIPMKNRIRSWLIRE